MHHRVKEGGGISLHELKFPGLHSSKSYLAQPSVKTKKSARPSFTFAVHRPAHEKVKLN